MNRFVLSVPKRGVESEELGEELGLGDEDGAVGVVEDVEAQEAGGVSVQSDFVVFSDVGDNGIDVGEGVTEYECVVHIYNDVCGFSWGYPIEKTVVEGGHYVPFCKKSLLLMEIEDTAGVW